MADILISNRYLETDSTLYYNNVCTSQIHHICIDGTLVSLTMRRRSRNSDKGPRRVVEDRVLDRHRLIKPEYYYIRIGKQLLCSIREPLLIRLVDCLAYTRNIL